MRLAHVAEKSASYLSDSLSSSFRVIRPNGPGSHGANGRFFFTIVLYIENRAAAILALACSGVGSTSRTVLAIGLPQKIGPQCGPYGTIPCSISGLLPSAPPPAE